MVCAKYCAVRGVSRAGLRIIVHPAAIAAPALRVAIASGKFHGVMSRHGPTGLCFAIPEGFEAQVRPRSGLAAKSGVTVLNAPGTIDSDYRGEVKVILVNFGDAPFVVHNGDRIAQLVVAPVTHANFVKADFLDATSRGEGGFGSTGVSV